MNIENKFFMSAILVAALMLASAIIPVLNVSVWSHGPLTGKGYKVDQMKGPNDGEVIKLEENYVEFVVDTTSGDIDLNILDEEMDPVPVPDDMTGLGYIGMIGSPVKWIYFKRVNSSQVPYLKAETGIENFSSFNALVGLTIGNESKNLNFSWSPDFDEHKK